MNNEMLQRTEEWLNDRWNIYQNLGKRAEDQAYYEGALKAVELLGINWKKGRDGKHRLYK